MTEDLTQFFADFGVAATIGTTALTVIFDADMIEVAVGNIGQLHENRTALVATASLPSGTAEGTAITINSTAYVIKNMIPDGTGITTLELRA